MADNLTTTRVRFGLEMLDEAHEFTKDTVEKEFLRLAALDFEIPTPR